MIIGALKNQVDRVWDAFWTGGISNPLEVIEQITYLLFLRRLDDAQTQAENKARRTGMPIVNPVFDPDHQHLRWQQLKNESSETMFTRMDREVFPFLRQLGQQVGGEGATYAHHMRDARFTIPNARMLSTAVDLIDQLPLTDQDTTGDLYEYLLSKIASAGVNGQFRTPRHIIDLMVRMTAPTPDDVIVDPACGTAGFLVGAVEYLREAQPDMFFDMNARVHFNRGMFHGYDFDHTMLRIASMNMLMHGVEAPDIAYRDSLAQGASDGDAGMYSLILANPPFAGSLDAEGVSSDLQRVVKTKKTELLFLALFLRLLQPGGRAAVIVPDGVLFGSTKAHKDLRKILVEEQQLEAVVKLPSGVFKPYAGVSTAILFFRRTDSGGTETVWFYDVRADGYSLDDKRTPTEADDLPDVLRRWEDLGAETDRPRTAQSFLVPKKEIADQGYDLSINRYKEIEVEEVEHRSPQEILADLEQFDAEISAGTAELKVMLQ
ncbi:type I restriction-modification system subunit M [Micrococcus sp. M4NT]|uniref:type I restriction-modification system subunit M n=1 Tax=Micrococcus sp. M4NT TaxID=2957501 RepID=UPI0029B73DAA|nr:class I SAM-dependent DNA methyltransferase [Micrococcus sp. M4NT]MDX2342004.1 type I restriction-modification system subunit M [Micrococcus sp. M4NT]